MGARTAGWTGSPPPPTRCSPPWTGPSSRQCWPAIPGSASAPPPVRLDARSDGWSRQEQAGTTGAAEQLRQELATGNLAYEQRFGHIFLICATGLSAETMLASLRSRLRNDPIAEREVVRGELVKIVRLRLAKAFR